MNTNILIPVETISRELTYKLVIAVLLSSKGLNCFLGAKKSIRELFNKVKPFIYLDKGYHEGVSEDLIYKPIIENGGRIINLDEEGGVDSIDYHALNRRMPNSIIQYFEKVFIWGESQYEFLKTNRNNYDGKKFIITGHPRFDLLKKQYEFLYHETEKAIKDNYGDFILINTMNKYSNHVRGYEFLLNNYGHRVKAFKKRVAYDNQKLKTTNKLIGALGDSFDCNIIVRPHPEENFDYYVEKYKFSKNIKIVNEYSAVPWLKACEVMIHHDCTTAIESIMLGKKPIAFIEDYDEELIFPGPVDVSYLLNDVNEVVNFIKEKKYTDCQEHSDILEQIFSFSKDSTFMVIDEIISTINYFTKIKEESLSISDYIGGYFSIIFQGIKKDIKQLLKKDDVLFNNKMKDFGNKIIIANLVDKIKEGFMLKQNIRVKKIGYDLYQLNLKQ